MNILNSVLEFLNTIIHCLFLVFLKENLDFETKDSVGIAILTLICAGVSASLIPVILDQVKFIVSLFKLAKRKSLRKQKMRRKRTLLKTMKLKEPKSLH